MSNKLVNATRVCDICGETYYGEQYGPYGENICDKCLTSEPTPLITTDNPDSEIPSSVNDEFDGGKDTEDDGE